MTAFPVTEATRPCIPDTLKHTQSAGKTTHPPIQAPEGLCPDETNTEVKADTTSTQTSSSLL